MPRILHIDDENAEHFLLKGNLKRHLPDLQITWEGVPRKILEIDREMDYDCILCDFQMPGMDGLALLKALRERGNEIPFIFLTGQGNEKVAAEALRSGADDYFTKDVGFAHYERLANSIERVIESRERERRRIEAENKILHLNLVLRAIRDVNQLITKERDISTLLDQACDILTRTRGYPFALIALTTKKGEITKLSSAGQMSDAFNLTEGDLIPEEAPSCLQAAFDGEGVTAIEEIDSFCGTCSFVDKGRGYGALGSRLEHHGQHYGVMLVALPHELVGDAEEQSLFEEVCSDISFALHKSELESRRLRAEIALVESEEKYRAVVEQLGEGVLLIKKEIIDANPAALRMIGMDRDEVIGKDLTEFTETLYSLDADSFKDRQAIWDTAISGETQKFERVIEKHDGTTGEFEVTLSAITLRGEKYLLATGYDVTERNKALRHSRESEELFRLAAHASSDLIHLWDPFDRSMVWFGDVEGALGYNPEEFEHTMDGLKRCVHPDDLEQLVEAIEQRIKVAEPFVYDYRVVRADGSIRYWQSRGLPLVDESGTPVKWIGAISDNTEKKLKELQLRESEERFRTIFEQAGLAMFVNDFEGNFIDVNPRACESLGYTREELLSMSIMDIDTERPDLESLQELWSDLAPGHPVTLEGRHKRKDGSEFPVDVRLVLMETGGERFMTAIVRDVSERVESERALRESEEKYRAVVEQIGETITLAKDVIVEVNPASLRLMGCEREDIIGKTLEEVSQFLNVDTDLSDEEKQTLLEAMMSGEPQKHERVITRTDGSTLEIESTQKAITIGGEKYLLLTGHDVTDRNRALRSLKEKEELFRLVAQTSSDLMHIWDPTDSSVEWFGDVEGMLGCKPGQLERNVEGFLKYVHPDDVEPLAEAIKSRIKLKDPFYHEFRVVRTDGSIRHWISRALPLFDESGTAVKWIGAISDNTEKKLQELKLRESEGRYRTLFEQAVDAIFVTDHEGNILDVNRTAHRGLGYTREELLDMHISDIDKNFVVDQKTLADAKALDPNRASIIERTHTRKDGSSFPVEIKGFLIEYQGHKVIVSVVRDISERKKQEAAVLEEGERFKTLLENAPVPALLYTEGKIVFINASALNEIGLDSAKEAISIDILKYVHPEYLDFAKKRIRKAYQGKEKSEKTEFEILRADGTSFCAEVFVSPANYQGRPASLVFFQNITSRKKSEQALRESEERFRALFEQAGIAMFIHDFEGKFVDVNPSACESLGYTSRELLQMTVEDIDTEFVCKEHRSKFWSQLAPGRPVLLESIHKRKDGTTYPVEVRLVQMEIQGQAYITATVNDISERRKSLEALRESEDRFRAIFEQAGLAMAINDFNGRFVDVNPRACENLGYTREEMLSMSVMDIDCGQTDLETLQELWSGLAPGHPVALQSRHKRKDGSEFPVDVQLVLMETGGERFMAAMVRDVSERVESERALRESEEKFRAVAEQSGEGIILVKDVIIDVNSTLLRHLGCKREDIIGKSVVEFEETFFPDNQVTREESRENWEAALAGETRRFDRLITRKDGSTIEIEIMMRGIDLDGEQYMLVTGHDVTERNRALRSLKENEERFRLAAQTSSNLIYEWDVASNNVEWFGNIDDMLGYESGHIEPTLENALSIVHPDDLEQLTETVKRFKESTEPFDIQFRVMRADGSIRHWKAQGLPVVGESGTPVKWIGAISDITERILQEKSLRESEERFRALFEQAGVGMFIHDFDGKFLDANPRACENLGYTCEELRQMTVEDVDAEFVSKEHRKNFWSQLAPEKPVLLEGVHKRKDGTTYPVEVRLVQIEIKGQHYIAATAYDITERKQTIEALRESEDRFRALFEFSGDAIAVTDKEGRIVDVNAQLSRNLGYTREELLQMSVADVDTEFFSHDHVQKHWSQLSQGHPVTLTGVHKRKDGSTFPVEVRIVMLDIGGKEYLLATVRDITERVESERALRESEDRFRALFEYAGDAIIVHDMEGRMLEANAQMEKNLGYTREELLKLDIADVDTEFVSHDHVKTFWSQLSKGHPVTFTGVHKRKDGTTFPVEIRLVLVEIGGQKLIVSTSRDISARVKSENALRESEERHRTMLENAPMPALMHAEGRVVFMNNAARDEFGFETAEEPIGVNPLDFIHPDHREEVRKRIGQIYTRRERLSRIELEMLRTDGSAFSVEALAGPAEYKGKPASLVIFQNITSRKRSELALKESEERFRLAAQSTSDLIFEWDIASGSIEWYGNIDGILGYEKGTIPRTVEGWVRLIHPDDRTRMQKAIEPLVNPSEPVAFEYRVVDAKGSTRIWSSLSRPIADESGRPVKWIGACTDITDRKLAEEALRSSEERFRIAAHATSDLIYEWDVANNTLEWYGDLDAALGYEQGEIPRTPEGWFSILHPDEVERMMEYVENRMESLEPIAYEYRTKHADGSTRIWSSYGMAIADDAGKPVKWIGACSDITDRRRAEEALKLSEERFRIAAKATSELVYEWDIASDGFVWHGDLDSVLGYEPGTIPHTREGALSIVHPDDLEGLVESIERYRNLLEPYEFTYRVIRADGSVRTWHAHALPVAGEDGKPAKWIGTLKDITEQRLSEEALRQSEEKFRALVESTSDWIWETDVVGRFIYVSPKIKDILGYEPEEVLGKRIYDFMVPEEAERTRVILEDTVSRLEPMREIVHRAIGRSGREVVIEANGVPIFNAAGENIGYRGIARDISELTLSNKQLQDANKELAAFAYTVSHDLRAPLRHMRSYTEMLRDGYADQFDEDGSFLVERIVASGQRMDEMISDILQLSTASRSELKMEEVDLSMIFKSIAYEGAGDSSERAVETRIGEGLSANCDSGLMRQVLQNLFDNAVKFTRTREKAVIEFGSESRRGERVFFVRDNGIGFENEHAESIFEPFRRLDDAGEYEGTGIGLSTVKRIVQRHGGRIWAVGEPDKGATFFFTLDG